MRPVIRFGRAVALTLVTVALAGACGGDDKPRAERPSILYARIQPEAGSGTIYRADVSGATHIGIGNLSSGSREVVSTSDGSRLAEWGDRHLAVATTETLTRFRTIVKLDDRGERIGQALWARDGSALAYVVYRELEPGKPFGASEKRLHIVNHDGTGARLVRRFRAPDQVVLVRLDLDAKALTWLATGEGGYMSDLSVIGTDDGAVLETFKEIPSGLYFDFPYSPDGRAAYYVEDATRIVEFSFTDRKKRVLYRARGRGREISAIVLSPGGEQIVFSERSSQGAETTYSMPVGGGARSALLEGPEIPSVRPRAWSPDGGYVWLDGEDGETFVLELTAKRASPFATPKRAGEEIRFLAWLPGDAATR